MEAAVDPSVTARRRVASWSLGVAFALMIAFFIVAPFVVYPIFVMKVLCFALFACAFNLLIGYVGLVSFGHALFFGWASYVTAHTAKVGVGHPNWPSSAARRLPPSSVSSPAVSPFAARAFISP